MSKIEDLINSFRIPKIADLGYSPYFATNIKFDFDIYISSNASFGKIISFDGWVVDIADPSNPPKVYFECNHKRILVERYRRDDVESAFDPEFKVFGEVGCATVVTNLPRFAIWTISIMSNNMIDKRPILSRIFL